MQKQVYSWGSNVMEDKKYNKGKKVQVNIRSFIKREVCSGTELTYFSSNDMHVSVRCAAKHYAVCSI